MRIESLIRELEHEAQTTRRHLERLPDGKLDWRPHPKSSTAGMLASHLVECVRWTPSIFAADELDMDPAAFRPYHAPSVQDLLRTFDAEVAQGQRAMAGSPDTSVQGLWQFKIRGKRRWEKPREDVFRDFTLSHLIHHRGQLSVYLRLMDIPVPGSYGTKRGRIVNGLRFSIDN
jgi:uncharacterized damage-inducible protein DinB